MSIRLLPSFNNQEKTLKTKGRQGKRQRVRAPEDYPMFLWNGRKKCIHISTEVEKWKIIHILTPTLSHTTNVIYSQSLPLAAGNKRTGKAQNCIIINREALGTCKHRKVPLKSVWTPWHIWITSNRGARSTFNSHSSSLWNVSLQHNNCCSSK